MLVLRATKHCFHCCKAPGFELQIQEKKRKKKPKFLAEIEKQLAFVFSGVFSRSSVTSFKISEEFFGPRFLVTK